MGATVRSKIWFLPLDNLERTSELLALHLARIFLNIYPLSVPVAYLLLSSLLIPVRLVFADVYHASLRWRIVYLRAVIAFLPPFMFRDAGR